MLKNKNSAEFIMLMAFMMALGAFSIDAILPAMKIIGDNYGVQNPNDNQLLVSLVFLGLAIGQIFFGPLSDSLGRKPAVYFGFLIFIIGSVLSVFAASFELMLASRFIQGIGLGAPRTIGVAMVRDRFVGDLMARVMSFIMVIFILVPIVAPAIGQGMLYLAGWKSIYLTQIAVALIILVWFFFRQEETLKPENKIPFSVFTINRAVLEIFKTRTTLVFTLIIGFIQGAFLVYLSSAQQVFQYQYGLGDKFPLIFALLAASIGIASLVNSKLVMTFGMEKMTYWALMAFTVISCGSTLLYFFTSMQNPSFLGFYEFAGDFIIQYRYSVRKSQRIGDETAWSYCGTWFHGCWICFNTYFSSAGDLDRKIYYRHRLSIGTWICRRRYSLPDINLLAKGSKQGRSV